MLEVGSSPILYLPSTGRSIKADYYDLVSTKGKSNRGHRSIDLLNLVLLLKFYFAESDMTEHQA